MEVTPGGGNDLVDARYSSIRLEAWGGAGSDTLVGGWGNDMLAGEDNPDRVIGNAGDDSVFGGGGRDAVFGGDGHDALGGDNGDDRVFGDAGNDLIRDLDRRDIVDGGADADWLTTYGAGDAPNHISIEGRTILDTQMHADPSIALQAIKRRDGQFAVVVAATHGGSGYARVFGELTRRKRTFDASVAGIDHAGPDGLRLAVVITELHTYILGRLADGTYTFNAGNDQRQLASIKIQIEGGRLTNPWTAPTPQTPTTVPISG